MDTPSAMTFRPGADDRAAFALLREELGERVSYNALISMALRELLKKHGLKLPTRAKATARRK